VRVSSVDREATSVEIHNGLRLRCPECSAALQHVGGCTRCAECGYSQCEWGRAARACSSGNGL